MWLVSDVVDAAAFAGAAEAWVGDGSGLGGSRAAMGDGDSVDGAVVCWVGAGITVTTAFGEGLRRRRVADGVGCDADVGELAALRLGDGSGGGGITLDGELEGCAAAGLGVGFADAVGFGVAVGLGVPLGLAFGLLVAFGVGAAADAGASASRVGVRASAAAVGRTGRRTPGTCEL